MTYAEFKKEYFYNMWNELVFTIGYSEMNKQIRNGSAWYNTESAIEHGKKFKKQWHDHMYNQRKIDYLTLKYK